MLKKIVIAIILTLWPLTFVLNFKSFKFSTDTVFKRDYQAEQLVLRNTLLYPTPLMARVFQNKARIYLNKYLFNLFVFADPNYYFFALHPEPIAGELNLAKYTFPSILFFIFGLIYFKNIKFKWPLIFYFSLSILILSSLTNFEGWDFILWIPVSLLCVHGVNMFSKRYPGLFNLYSIFFLLFSAVEIIRAFYNR